MVAQGHGDEICCRSVFACPKVQGSHGRLNRFRAMGGAPVTARRLLALYRRCGDDDVFSSDLTDEELRAALGPLGSCGRCLILQSGADEYVPPSVDVPALAARMASAAGPCVSYKVVEGAKHAMDGREGEAAAIISSFVSTL